MYLSQRFQLLLVHMVNVSPSIFLISSGFFYKEQHTVKPQYKVYELMFFKGLSSPRWAFIPRDVYSEGGGDFFGRLMTKGGVIWEFCFMWK